MNLELFGWNPFFSDCFNEIAFDGEVPGRVIFASNELFRIRTERAEIPARLSGRFRFRTDEADGFPVVGDWVIVEQSGHENTGLIQSLLPRISKISRKKPGSVSSEQLLAANVDYAFIMTTPNSDLSIPRVERYITALSEERVRPVVLMNKVDLIDDRLPYEEKAQRITESGIPIHWISCSTGEGIDGLRAYLSNSTIVVLGSSGVGKSSLVNCILADNRQKVTETRESDDKGRHTTTSRQLMSIGNGSVVIDTPGLREIQLYAADFQTAFSDFDQFARQCRFRNCLHLDEPGCKVRQAVEEGLLDAGRLRSYAKLLREQRHLNTEKTIRARRDERRRNSASQQSKKRTGGKRSVRREFLDAS